MNDIFDPEYKGKVVMVSELREVVPLVMKAEGIDPGGMLLGYLASRRAGRRETGRAGLVRRHRRIRPHGGRAA